jgi:hypothetical protein
MAEHKRRRVCFKQKLNSNLLIITAWILWILHIAYCPEVMEHCYEYIDLLKCDLFIYLFICSLFNDAFSVTQAIKRRVKD